MKRLGQLGETTKRGLPRPARLDNLEDRANKLFRARLSLAEPAR